MDDIRTAVPHASGILAFSVEEERLRACLLDVVDADHRLVGWINVERSRQAPLTGQLAAVVHRLGSRLGRPLWNRFVQTPYLTSPDPIREPPLAYVTGAIAPGAALRVWIAGLTPRVSVDAARRVLASAPVQVVGTTAYADTQTGTLDVAKLTDLLTRRHPDTLIVVGGYDSDNTAARESMVELCRIFANALKRLPPAQMPLVIYAGNREAVNSAHGLLRDIGSAVRIEVVANIQPAPGVDDRSALVRELHYHLWQRTRREPGILRLERWISEPAQLTSLDWSFAQLVQVWCRWQGQRELHAAYQSAVWRLHVWCAEGQESVHFAYRPAHSPQLDLPGWPPLTIYSGELPDKGAPPPGLRLWDRSGMAPLIATTGQIDATAMLQTLHLDLFKHVDQVS